MTYKSQFSSSPMWVLGMELMSSDSAANAFTPCAILLANKGILKDGKHDGHRPVKACLGYRENSRPTWIT